MVRKTGINQQSARRRLMCSVEDISGMRHRDQVASMAETFSARFLLQLIKLQLCEIIVVFQVWICLNLKLEVSDPYFFVFAHVIWTIFRMKINILQLCYSNMKPSRECKTSRILRLNLHNHQSSSGCKHTTHKRRNICRDQTSCHQTNLPAQRWRKMLSRWRWHICMLT